MEGSTTLVATTTAPTTGPTTVAEYRKQPLDKRIADFKKFRARPGCADRVPCMLTIDDKTLKATWSGKWRFAVFPDTTVGAFMHMVRKQIQLRSDQAIFLFVDNSMPQQSRTIGDIYREFRCEDGMLYLTIMGESVYGC